jgi:CRP-like cAMP-binding protein
MPAREFAKAAAGQAQGALEALKLIQGWKWFAYVPPEGQQWLAERAVLREVEKGRQIYVSGQPVSHIYAVISGVFRIYLASRDGDELTLEEVVRGAWFPHYQPLPKPSYTLNCVCQSEALVAAFPEPAIAEFARRWPGYYQGLYHELTDRAVTTFGRIELLSLHSLTVRLAVYLLRLARLRGQRDAEGATWLAAHESQAEIGARVGGTRQRVNLAMKSWARKGIVEPHKDGIRILDLPRLMAEAKKSGFDVDGYLAGWHGGWQGVK